jgi:hypothetical protein
VYDTDLEEPSSGTLKVKIFESEMIQKSLEARKPNRTDKIG